MYAALAREAARRFADPADDPGHTSLAAVRSARDASGLDAAQLAVGRRLYECLKAERRRLLPAEVWLGDDADLVLALQRPGASAPGAAAGGAVAVPSLGLSQVRVLRSSTDSPSVNLTCITAAWHMYADGSRPDCVF